MNFKDDFEILGIIGQIEYLSKDKEEFKELLRKAYIRGYVDFDDLFHYFTFGKEFKKGEWCEVEK